MSERQVKIRRTMRLCVLVVFICALTFEQVGAVAGWLALLATSLVTYLYFRHGIGWG